MAVYVIAGLTIKDTVRFEDYRRTALPTMEKYGGRLVARGEPIVLEGEWPERKAHHRGISQYGGAVNQEIGWIFARVLEMPLIRHSMETISRIRAMSICRHESSD